MHVVGIKQKIVLSLGVVLLVLSFVFPTWGDSYPLGDGPDFVITKFVGYGLLFDPPSYYQFQDYDIWQYSEKEMLALNLKRTWHDLRVAEKYRRFCEAFPVTPIKNRLDSLNMTGRGDRHPLVMSVQEILLDSLLDSLNDAVDTTMLGRTVREHRSTSGFVVIYVDILLIQLAVILCITIGLFLVFRPQCEARYSTTKKTTP